MQNILLLMFIMWTVGNKNWNWNWNWININITDILKIKDILQGLGLVQASVTKSWP